MTTPAHDAQQTHRYLVSYPAHAPRKSDPNYRDFEAYRRKTHKTAKCQFAVKIGDFTQCDGPLELHHTHIEFAMQNGIDLTLLERDYPGVSDPSKVGAWVESADNLTWLCVIPGTPVLMADGSTRPIEYVSPGDRVITHDGSPQLVDAVSRKRYRGEVIGFGGATFTPTHRILTDRGWLSAAEILSQVRMHGPDVILLRSEQHQVIRSVVGSIAVEMMDTLALPKPPTDDLLHHVPMLEHPVLPTVAPDDHSNVALVSKVSTTAIGSRSLLPIESDDAAIVGAVQVGARLPVRRPMERITADFAAPKMRWITSVPTTAFYNGWVHDLSVPHNHSFIAGGIAAHNCEWHHRGHGGVHCASSADYEAEHYVRKLIS